MHSHAEVWSSRPPPRTLVSCSVGFSRPGGAKVRSLQDLLRAIQPLNIRLTAASSLRNPQRAGEGASYTVFRYTDVATNKAVAVKQIKLAQDANNHQAHQDRVECVLKDIEVMCHPPLAQHENILTLLGYGWGLRQGDTIPFIVTDYAACGTLRDYLQSVRVPMSSKLSLCSQVACGLNRMHWAGVAHGDLKLENVLVFPSHTIEGSGTYETDVTVKPRVYGSADLDDSQTLDTHAFLGTSKEMVQFRFIEALFDGSWNEMGNIEDSLQAMPNLPEGGWSYENFLPKVASRIPFRLKEQMVLDAKRTALTECDISTRAAFQVALAFFNGFGIDRDMSIAMQYMRMSSSSTCLPFEIHRMVLQDRYHNTDKLRTTVQGYNPLCSIFTKLGVWASPTLHTGSSCQFLSPYGLNKLKACQLGDLEALRSLAPRKEKLLPRKHTGPTPLHYLFMFDQDEETLQRALEILLPTHLDSRSPLLESYCSEAQTLDQQLPFSLKGTPLAFAVDAGSLAAVKALLGAGANPLSRSPEKYQKSSFARYSAAGMRAILIQDGLEIAKDLHRSINDISRLSIPSFLGEEQQKALLQSLLEMACKGNITPNRAIKYIDFGEVLFSAISPAMGFQALLSAVRHHNDSLFALLLPSSQHLHQVDEDGRSIIWHMIDSGFSHMIPLSKVFEQGLKLDDVDSFGESYLHCAVRNRSVDDTVTLINMGLDVDRKLLDGTTAMHIAVQNTDTAMIQCLLDHGASINAADNQQRSPIHSLFLQTPQHELASAIAVAKLLLSRGASTTTMDSDGSTPVHALALWDVSTVCSPGFASLIRRMSLSARDKLGATILHSAARLFKDKLVAILIQSGAKVDDQDNKGATPLHALISQMCLMRFTSNDQIIPTTKALLQAGPRMDLVDKYNRTAIGSMILACKNQNTIQVTLRDTGVQFEQRLSLVKCILLHCYMASPVYPSLVHPISHAWEVAVLNMRWSVVREMLFHGKVDLGLLAWPRGIRFLLYSIEHVDLCMLRLFLGRGFEHWSPHILARDATQRLDPSSEISKANMNWSPEKHILWESQIPAYAVHSRRGNGDILREILEFLVENKDLYKLELLDGESTIGRPVSWVLIDQLATACQLGRR
ncbi:hypothetical protein FPRO03_10128 [Fusarium proliferatum]|nr:hypothetical protein FPRO03_10128 [Fusarium proliferatum]